MRVAQRIILFVCLGALSACAAQPRIERVDDFASLYDEVTFAEGVVGAPPPPRERVGEPPTVVNWFYTGTVGEAGDAVHRVVLRTATWDRSTGEPVGSQTWYDVSAEQLAIREPIARTREVGRWVPLHEAASGVEPPPGLGSWRESSDPVEVEPSELPVPPGELELPELPDLQDVP
jgi:hypothetical protein